MYNKLYKPLNVIKLEYDLLPLLIGDEKIKIELFITITILYKYT